MQRQTVSRTQKENRTVVNSHIEGFFLVPAHEMAEFTGDKDQEADASQEHKKEVTFLHCKRLHKNCTGALFFSKTILCHS